MLSNHVIKELSAYCNEELSSARSREVAEHLISCSRCRARFEEIKLGTKLAEQLPPLVAPQEMWNEIESALTKHPTPRTIPLTRNWYQRPQFVALAACLAFAAIAIGVWLFRDARTTTIGSAWQVAALDGQPTIGSTRIADKGLLGVGQWLETDNNSRAEIDVATIGKVEVDPNTRLRLLQTQPTEHRLELARGRMSARIWAPPRLFFVDTPSAVAADLGCAYTLDVDDAGSSLLRVSSGWVALQLKDRESIVPAGAACQTRSGIGPGTPYFEDAPADFVRALEEFDFGDDERAKPVALNRVIRDSRVKDTLTLWHLISRVNSTDRRRVYEKIASLVEPPSGVSLEKVMQLDQETLKTWKEKLEFYWVGSVMDIKQGKGLSKSGKLKDGTNLEAK